MNEHGLISQTEFEWIRDAQLLVRYVPGVVLDVGSGSGLGSTLALLLGQAKAGTNKTVVCVDPWAGDVPEAHEDAFDSAMAEFKGRCRKVKAISARLWATLHEPVAFAFIDSGIKANTFVDVFHAMKLASPGGIVAVHDKQYPDVKTDLDNLGFALEAGESIRWAMKV